MIRKTVESDSHPHLLQGLGPESDKAIRLLVDRGISFSIVHTNLQESALVVGTIEHRGLKAIERYALKHPKRVG